MVPKFSHFKKIKKRVFFEVRYSIPNLNFFFINYPIISSVLTVLKCMCFKKLRNGERAKQKCCIIVHDF